MDRLIKLAISLGVWLGDAVAGRLPGARESAGTCVVITYHTIARDSISRFGRQLDTLIRLASPMPGRKAIPDGKGAPLCRRHRG